MKLIKLLLILLMSAAFVMFAQTIAPKKCNTCGKPLAQCQYKGRHPNPAASEKPAKQRTQAAKPVQPSNPTSGYLNGHEWVDLGLPSGTKWATMNVGASSPSYYGSHFAWGETSPKSSYSWSNLKYCLDTTGDKKFSKYVTDSKFGTVDGKRELDLSDDVAYVNWGRGWRIPSKAQRDELFEKCKKTWTTMDEVSGIKIVGLNGNILFLPGPAGQCYYWTREVEPEINYDAYILSVDNVNAAFRCDGLFVRAVLVTE